ncbi:MAG: hypothetical protein ACXABY_34935, partial [Candidatus Thorarchaeota archaeon]
MRQEPRIGIGKLTVMLLITWLTLFVGLGNLIFLRTDSHYRTRAIIALSVGVGSAIAVSVLVHG